LQGQVNVSVANLYAEGTYRSETISQVLLGEMLDIQESDGDFSLVRASDGYSGWMSNYQWLPWSKYEGEKVLVRNHFSTILSKPAKSSVRIRDVVLGTWLNKVDENQNWLQVLLPDGVKGWIDKDHIGSLVDKKRDNFVDIANEFLGYPYLWGGKTPKGFDCSGLVQVVLYLTGTHIRRDSWMQHHDAKIVSEDHTLAQPGDFLFFAQNRDKISHVGIALGNSKILHARGFVRINSLNSKDKLFDQHLHDTFVDVRTCF
jgi:gamma-D-glutamyl-L-lysine dipeptidyl-peptidase